jgi:hypothetical protein
MRKILVFIATIFFLFLASLSVQAQLLSVGQETEMTILGGTDFSVDKLVLNPDREYSIRNNSISISRKNLFDGGKSLSRTYVFENSPLPFTGKLTVGLEEKVSASTVSIQVFDNFYWNGISTRKHIINHQLVEGMVDGSKVTKAITVSENNGKGDFAILTNPAVNKVITVEIYKPGEYQIQTAEGKLLKVQSFSAGIHRIDLSPFAHASYFMSNKLTTRKFIL